MYKSKTIYNKLLLSIVILAIFVILTFIIKNYFKPFFIIIFMTFMCKPLYDGFCKIDIFNENVNGVLSILFVNLILFFCLFYTGKIIYAKACTIVLDNYSRMIKEINIISSNLNNFLEFDLLNLNSNMSNTYSIISADNYIKRGAIYTTEGIFAYFVSNMAVYFILTDKYWILDNLSKLFSEEKFVLFKFKLGEMNKVLRIEIMLVLITTIQTLMGFILLNVENSVFLSVLCGILDIIPYIGTIVVFVPLIIYNFILKRTTVTIGLIALYILLQITRQILETKLVSKNLNIHPLVMILTMYIGVKVFGIVGVFMAPLYIITTKEIVFSTVNASGNIKARSELK